MKCPNCGEELKEGYLYCEKCGEDIHIVPDFEPALEWSLKSAVEEIMDQEAEEMRLEQEKIAAKKQRLHQLCKIAGAAVAVCLFIVCIFVGLEFLQQKRESSFEYQLNKAYECLAKENAKDALIFYEKAVNLRPNDVNARLEMAELYRQLGMEVLYMEQLQTIVSAEYSDEYDRERAYEKMIAFYEAKEAYAQIHNLLLTCSNQNIVNANQKYLAKGPEFSYEEGTYAEIIPLKISANAAGTVYYTTDGSIPTKESNVYTSPIFLETGEHVISAFFVNDYDIASEVVTKEYVIEVQRPAAPEVMTYSGNYFAPEFITVNVPAECRVFYTTDGSYPTDQSSEYFWPIPMPIGKSWYKFVVYSQEGVAGEVTSREFELVIDAPVSLDEACQAVKDLMMAFGKIYNSLGESYQVEGKYQYIFQYPLAMAEQGDYYIIAEFYEDTAGYVSPTGSEYAVNIYNENVYKFTEDNGNYLLEGF